MSLWEIACPKVQHSRFGISKRKKLFYISVSSSGKVSDALNLEISKRKDLVHGGPPFWAGSVLIKPPIFEEKGKRIEDRSIASQLWRLGQWVKRIFLKDWKKSTFSLFPLKGKPGDGEPNQKRRIENLHRGPFFFETRSYLWGGKATEEKMEKNGKSGFFFPNCPHVPFCALSKSLHDGGGGKTSLWNCSFLAALWKLLLFPVRRRRKRLLLKTTISIIMLFSLTRKCPVTLCLSEKGFFFFLFFRARVRLWFPIKRNKRKRLSLYSFQKGASGGKKSKKCSFPQKLTSSGKIDTFTVFGKAEGVVCLFSFQTGSLRCVDLCGKRGVVCQQRLFVYENELEEGFPFPSF